MIHEHSQVPLRKPTAELDSTVLVRSLNDLPVQSAGLLSREDYSTVFILQDPS